MQKKYLYKAHPGRSAVIKQGDIEHVSYEPLYKVKEYINVPGFAKIPVSQSTGKLDRSTLRVRMDGMALITPATREEVRDRIRRLREQEAARLDEIDKQIAALRAERAELIKTAWQRGNVVTVKELTDLIKV